MKRIVTVLLGDQTIDIEIDILSTVLANDSHHIKYLVKEKVASLVESIEVISNSE